MDLGLENRIVLVCGGSRGLGLGCARIFAEEGAIVALVARGKEDLEAAATSLEQETGATVRSFAADLDSPEERRTLIDSVTQTVGAIDILVTNNGGPPAGGFSDVTDDGYRLALERNLMSAIHLSHLVIPSMRERGWGRVIHVTSISVVQPIPGLLLSNVARVGLAGFTKTVAPEVAADGVRMHLVCPGSHDTERIRDLARARAQSKQTDEESEMKAIVAAIPVGRLGKTEELGGLVAFLASQRADFLTGTIIPVDGGAYRGML